MESGYAINRWLVGGVLTVMSAGVVLALAGIDYPARVPVVVVFLLVTPALAVSSLLTGLDWLGKVVVAGAAAVVVNAAVAATLLLAGAWSPRTGLVLVALISALPAAIRLVLHRKPRMA
jgi:hypothetical protein